MRRWAVVFVAPVLCWMWLGLTPAHAQTSTAIVAVHGGGWANGTPAKMDRVCDTFEGTYDCFQPSYTLSGTGRFNRANADLRAYVLDLRAQGYTRIIGIGGSAGGNLVAWLASHGYVDAAVTLSAPTQLLVLHDWTTRGCPAGCIAQFAPSQQLKANASPALDTVEVPIYIAHSVSETLIPAMQANRLAWVSTQDTLVMVPGTQHGNALWDDLSPSITEWIGALA